jgi:hypothetical protein
MYAVVYQNQVIVGPMAWSRGMFQGALERKGIINTLPRTAPELSELPYVVTEDAKIMPVEEVRPEINSMVEHYYGPLWTFSETTAVATYEVHDTVLMFAQQNFTAQAAEERYKREVSGVKTTIQDREVTVDTSRGARDIFVQKYLLMSDTDTVNWKFPEAWLLLTKAELGTAVTAGAAHVQSCFDWERGIVDQINAATTKQQLLAIEIVEPPQASENLMNPQE